MTQYRKTELKIFNKIDSIAKKGKDGIFSYYVYVDQLVDNSQYSVLEDVLVNYYGIDARRFSSVDDLKKKSFHLIRELTNTSLQQSLKKLFDVGNVYQIGFHFFDSTSNKYLGDIQEFDTKTNWDYYNNEELRQKLDESNTKQNPSLTYIGLEVECGLMESIIESVPQYLTDKTLTITYINGDQVIWENQLVQCIYPYTWSKNNQIYPDDHTYWEPVTFTYSKYQIIDNTNIITKYKSAIIFVKNYNYITIDSSLNNYVDPGYIDDYID